MVVLRGGGTSPSSCWIPDSVVVRRDRAPRRAAYSQEWCDGGQTGTADADPPAPEGTGPRITTAAGIREAAEAVGAWWYPRALPVALPRASPWASASAQPAGNASADASAADDTAHRVVTSRRPAPSFSTGTQHRLGLRRSDLEVVEAASAAITDLGRELDRQLAQERRPSERMRMLREATNRITRTANDAVQAYRRASRAIRNELERADANVEAAERMRTRLDEARANVLRALSVANERYAPEDRDGTPKRR